MRKTKNKSDRGSLRVINQREYNLRRGYVGRELGCPIDMKVIEHPRGFSFRERRLHGG